jgi:hypothetical protein
MMQNVRWAPTFCNRIPDFFIFFIGSGKKQLWDKKYPRISLPFTPIMKEMGGLSHQACAGSADRIRASTKRKNPFAKRMAATTINRMRPGRSINWAEFACGALAGNACRACMDYYMGNREIAEAWPEKILCRIGAYLRGDPF